MMSARSPFGQVVERPPGVRLDSRDGSGRVGTGLDCHRVPTASDLGSSPALSRLQGECATLLRELGPDWQTPLPAKPTPDQEVAAWMRDGRLVHAAAQRLRERRRLVAFYRQRLRELEAA